MSIKLPAPNLARRASLKVIAGGFASLIAPSGASAEGTAFDQWIATFRTKAIAHGITEETYARVMLGMRPDTAGLEAIRNQPEFNQKLWQYLNRAASDWKITAGKEAAKKYAPLFSRIEKDFGVEPAFMLGVWGIESAFGDPVVEKNHMRPVIPSLATLAWAAPPRLLATGAHQRAHDRAARLEHAGTNGRLLGRRHGTYAMDAGSLASRRHRLQWRRQNLALWTARRCARLDRPLLRRTRRLPARRTLGL